MSIAHFLLVLAVAVPLMTGAVHAAQPHSHDDNGAVSGELRLKDGRKWPTDAALRTGMEGIRAAMAGELRAIHRGTLPPEGYRTLAHVLEAKVDGIVQTCKLPEDADAQLHLVLAPIIDGIEAMAKGKAQRDGAIRIVGALDAYGRHFDHPGWIGVGQ